MSHNANHGHGSSAAAGEQVIDLYPAGAEWSHHHHGHVVVPQRLLLGVLAILLFFTLLTVAAAQAEHWFSHTFDVVIPQWVNVAVALSIAAVKTTIVALYFMQLRYDNPMNAMVVVFTLFVLAFFLGFTAIDLTSRDTLYAEKAHAIVPGGAAGEITTSRGESVPLGRGMATFAREKAETVIDNAIAAGVEIENAAAAKFEHHRIEEIIELRREGKPLPPELAAHVAKLLKGIESLHKAGKHLPAWLHEFEEEYHANPGPGSGPDQSRPRRGITMPGLAPAAGHGAEGGHGESGGKAPEHKPETKGGA